MESDCAAIVSLLNNRESNHSALFALVMDVWHFGNVFKEVSFRSMRRTSNKMAHELAALARRRGDYYMIGDLPPLRTTLTEDCNSSTNCYEVVAGLFLQKKTWTGIDSFCVRMQFP